jgi:hypothetical protein
MYTMTQHVRVEFLEANTTTRLYLVLGDIYDSSGSSRCAHTQLNTENEPQDC